MVPSSACSVRAESPDLPSIACHRRRCPPLPRAARRAHGGRGRGTPHGIQPSTPRRLRREVRSSVTGDACSDEWHHADGIHRRLRYSQGITQTLRALRGTCLACAWMAAHHGPDPACSLAPPVGLPSPRPPQPRKLAPWQARWTPARLGLGRGLGLGSKSGLGLGLGSGLGLREPWVHADAARTAARIQQGMRYRRQETLWTMTRE